ncbi:MAG: hypothetical protein K2Q22_11635, partial [Cytophagales bacterium]|nr:hypothetical protein [Cytophagales bacterium]
MKRITFIITALLGLTTICNSQTTQIKPTGVYKEIDVANQNKTVQVLNGKNKKLKLLYQDSILQKPNN